VQQYQRFNPNSWPVFRWRVRSLRALCHPVSASGWVDQRSGRGVKSRHGGPTENALAVVSIKHCTMLTEFNRPGFNHFLRNSYRFHARHCTIGSGINGMSADVIKLSDHRKVARPVPDAFKLSLLLISAYLAFGILFFDAFVEASRKLTIGETVI
jgi:hypothetical protein